MYRLNGAVVSSVSHVLRQLSASLSVNGNSLCGSLGLQRTLCSSAVNVQQTPSSSSSSSSSTTESEMEKSDFSNFPPMPGQPSAQRWGGKKFDELPIVHIKATYNNTHIQVTDGAGNSLVRTSCGTEGFKNVKKSTPVAAQTAGVSAASKAMTKGVTFVRVVVKGLGQGRLNAIQGLTQGGLEVVSITDNTPVPHNGCRPRKARRI